MLCVAAVPSFANATVEPSASVIDGINPAVSSRYLAVVRHDGALAYYPLSDTSSVMRDLGPHAHNGSYGSGVAHTGVLTAMNTSSASFSGGSFNRNGFASAGIASELQPSNVSIEGWVSEKVVNPGSKFVPMIVYGRQNIGPAYSMTISPQNTLRFWAKTTTGSVTCGGYNPLIPGQIYHFVTTYNGSKVVLYVNGHVQASCNGSGRLNYSGLSSRDGLAIGGALDTGVQQFDGVVAHVAVYGSALSPAQVLSHFVDGVKPEILNENVPASSKFVNTIGVNTHLHYQNTVYDRSWPQVRALLLGLGIHHIRDGLIDSGWRSWYDRLEDLGRNGIHCLLTTSLEQSTALLAAYPKRLPISFEAYEGPNEVNITYKNDPQWPQKLRSFQQKLYAAVKGNRATAGYRVVGPSVTSMGDIERVGNISSYIDFGNVHDYVAAYNPGTEGFGSHTPYGVVGSLSWNSNVAGVMSGTRPIVATETGYNTGVAVNTVPMDVQGKYIPRLTLELYNQGVQLSEIYQLIDWNPSDHSNNYGLVEGNLHPKPAYYALQSLIGLLKDTASPAPTAVSYSLSGDVGNVHHAMFRKGDGSYYLALWIETRDFIPTPGSSGGGTRVLVNPQTVTITAPRRLATESMATIEDSGAISRTSSRLSGNSVNVNVTNNVSIVRLTF